MDLGGSERSGIGCAPVPICRERSGVTSRSARLAECGSRGRSVCKRWTHDGGRWRFLRRRCGESELLFKVCVLAMLPEVGSGSFRWSWPQLDGSRQYSSSAVGLVVFVGLCRRSGGGSDRWWRTQRLRFLGRWFQRAPTRCRLRALGRDGDVLFAAVLQLLMNGSRTANEFTRRLSSEDALQGLAHWCCGNGIRDGGCHSGSNWAPGFTLAAVLVGFGGGVCSLSTMQAT